MMLLLCVLCLSGCGAGDEEKKNIYEVYHISNTETKVVLHEHEMKATTPEEMLNELLTCLATTPEKLEYMESGRQFQCRLLHNNGLYLHASAVEKDGKAYLFSAPSGTGKSTHTRLWRQVFGSRAVMVNDDKPFLKLTEAGIFACGSPWSGKHGLDTNMTVPLQGICILERGKENRIERISVSEALPMLLHQSYCPLDPKKRVCFENLVKQLAEKTPLWRMYCNMDPAAAEVSHSAMSQI